jgi:hypothetical protein
MSRLRRAGRALGGRQDNGDDQTVQTKSLGENEDKDHGDVKLGLLTVRTDTGVTDDANGKAGTEGGQTAAKTGGKVGIAVEARVSVLKEWTE